MLYSFPELRSNPKCGKNLPTFFVSGKTRSVHWGRNIQLQHPQFEKNDAYGTEREFTNNKWSGRVARITRILFLSPIQNETDGDLDRIKRNVWKSIFFFPLQLLYKFMDVKCKNLLSLYRSCDSWIRLFPSDGRAITSQFSVSMTHSAWRWTRKNLFCCF